jgi:hypothetical protein
MSLLISAFYISYVDISYTDIIAYGERHVKRDVDILVQMELINLEGHPASFRMPGSRLAAFSTCAVGQENEKRR